MVMIENREGFVEERQRMSFDEVTIKDLLNFYTAQVNELNAQVERLRTSKAATLEDALDAWERYQTRHGELDKVYGLLSMLRFSYGIDLAEKFRAAE